MRPLVASVVLFAGCSWELSPPIFPDAALDAATPREDRSVPNDLPGDALRPDAGAALDRVEVAVASDVVVLPEVIGSPDVVDVLPALPDLAPPPDRVDVPTAVDLPAPQDLPSVTDLGYPECIPGSRRVCFSGPAASRGVGVCRDGVQTCLPTGRWPTMCEGQILPSCEGRVCGSDGCGGSCGTCSGGPRCDDTGRCVAPTCGGANFALTCPDSTRCPRDSRCESGGRCVCDEGFVAVTCAGVACGACTFPDWWCERRFFCGSGAIVCPGGWLCPARSRCVDATRGCACEPGFVAVDCGGSRCTNCVGVGYRCVPP